MGCEITCNKLRGVMKYIYVAEDTNGLKGTCRTFEDWRRLVSAIIKFETCENEYMEIRMKFSAIIKHIFLLF